jgi:hypothetical protein
MYCIADLPCLPNTACVPAAVCCQAIAHLSGSCFFDLSPRNTDGHYPGKAVAMLLHMVFKVSLALSSFYFSSSACGSSAADAHTLLAVFFLRTYHHDALQAACGRTNACVTSS